MAGCAIDARRIRLGALSGLAAAHVVRIGSNDLARRKNARFGGIGRRNRRFVECARRRAHRRQRGGFGTLERRARDGHNGGLRVCEALGCALGGSGIGCCIFFFIVARGEAAKFFG